MVYSVKSRAKMEKRSTDRTTFIQYIFCEEAVDGLCGVFSSGAKLNWVKGKRSGVLRLWTL